MKRRSLAGMSLVLLTAAPLPAQFIARFDLASSNRYVWHGLSRAAGIVFQPSFAAGYRIHRLTLASGLARHYELDRVSPGELSELGTGKGHLGEDDFWAQADLDLGRLQVRSGVLRYVFRGDAPEGGAGPLRNTTELYATAGITSAYLNPSLEAWWDVDRVRGGFLRASASSPVFAWPYEQYFFITVAGELGVNLGQAPDSARPSDLANFADRGLTHAGLGLNAVFRLRQWQGLGTANLALSLQSQLNLDDATRYNGVGRSHKLILWLSAGITLLLGGQARIVR